MQIKFAQKEKAGYIPPTPHTPPRLPLALTPPNLVNLVTQRFGKKKNISQSENHVMIKRFRLDRNKMCNNELIKLSARNVSVKIN